jgi:hypothetical protein
MDIESGIAQRAIEAREPYSGVLGRAGLIGRVRCGPTLLIFRRFQERDGRIFVHIEDYEMRGSEELPNWSKAGSVAFYADSPDELIRTFAQAVAHPSDPEPSTPKNPAPTVGDEL